jgi:hypothetical protein
MTALARVQGASTIQGLWLRRLLMAAVSAALAHGPARITGRQGLPNRVHFTTASVA